MIRAPRSLTERNATVAGVGFPSDVGWALAQLQAHPRPLRPATQVRQPQCAAVIAPAPRRRRPPSGNHDHPSKEARR